MKCLHILIILLTPLINHAQPNTEVFLFDLNQEHGGFELSNFRNISNNEGYDNQPSFPDNNTMLYSGTRNGQTDIVEYNIANGEKRWVCNTEGSEYSPLKIPGQDAISAIRLDKDGTQLLRKYSLQKGASDVLIDDLVIGYQVWFNETILVATVLEEDYMSLYTSNLKKNQNYRWQKKVGRSLHKIPHSELVSYISKEKDSVWEIKALDPISGNTTYLFNTLPNTEDMCWLSDGTALMANDGVLYGFHMIRDDDWVKLASLSEYGIKNITRLAVSPDGTKLAVLGETSNNSK
ncbi:MAG TPA: hypothetical protein VJ945_01500 [Flavobacteriaceae bacterium]|nr:hypothetical protein [Flavobacteriaceae bacterium]